MTSIDTPVPDDCEAIAQLYAQAFEADPVWSAIVPDPEWRRRVIATDFRSQLRNDTDHFDIVRGEDGEVLGALNFELPRKDGQKAPSLRDTLMSILEHVTPAGRRGARHQEAVDAYRPSEDHWYFHDLVTSPAARGRGLGRALLDHRLAIVDADPLPVFLESTTPASRRLYERYGFEVVATVSELEGTESFAMIRPAQEPIVAPAP